VNRTLAALSFVLFAAAAYAQLPVPTRPIAFSNATVIDVKNGRSMPATTVVVAGNRIASVNTSREARLPDDARVIDASGKFLIPGLWDMHAQLGAGGASRPGE
jgi:imidazolonepropionase-like amidohydrolase